LEGEEVPESFWSSHNGSTLCLTIDHTTTYHDCIQLPMETSVQLPELDTGCHVMWARIEGGGGGGSSSSNGNTGGGSQASLPVYFQVSTRGGAINDDDDDDGGGE